MFKILKSSTWLFLGGDVMDGFYFLFCIFMYFPHFLQWAFIFLKIREHISSKGELKTVYLWHINPGARGSTFNEVDFSIPYSDFLQVCARGIEIVLKKKKKNRTPVLLPGKSHGWRSLVGYSLWGRKESDTTEPLHFHFHFPDCRGFTLLLRLWLQPYDPGSRELLSQFLL